MSTLPNTEKKKIEPLALTPDTIVDIINKNELVLIDFWAEWCPPCLMQGEEIEKNGNQIVEKYPTLKLCKMNVDTDKGISNNLNIEYIPEIVIFYKGHIGIMQSGVRPIEEILKFIGEFLTHTESCPDEVVDVPKILFEPPPPKPKEKPKKKTKKETKKTEKATDQK